MNFSEKVRAARKEKNMTQIELSRAMNVSLRTVAGWESDNRKPKQKRTLEDLARVLDRDPTYFIFDDPVPAAEMFGFTQDEQARRILEEVKVMFAGGALPEEDKMQFMLDLQTIMLESKKEAARRAAEESKSQE